MPFDDIHELYVTLQLSEFDLPIRYLPMPKLAKSDWNRRVISSTLNKYGLPEQDSYVDDGLLITRIPRRKYHSFEIDLDNEIFYGSSVPFLILRN